MIILLIYTKYLTIFWTILYLTIFASLCIIFVINTNLRISKGYFFQGLFTCVIFVGKILSYVLLILWKALLYGFSKMINKSFNSFIFTFVLFIILIIISLLFLRFIDLFIISNWYYMRLWNILNWFLLKLGFLRISQRTNFRICHMRRLFLDYL
jgi:hypothetical protein